ncbi:MAG: cytochrome C [Chlamydiota bacterium]|nr:cytochrome C [Chlamydiota bacterium]
MNIHTKHYFRAGFLIIALVIVIFVVRAFLIPKSFGKFGFYRADNVTEQMDKPVRFAPLDSCSACHDEIWQKHQKGVHKSVQCQNCHDILPVHVDVDKGEIVGPMPIQRTTALCLRCHNRLSSRPVDFPQIDVDDHFVDSIEIRKAEVCFGCHNPHSPRGED